MVCIINDVTFLCSGRDRGPGGLLPGCLRPAGGGWGQRVQVQQDLHRLQGAGTDHPQGGTGRTLPL